MNITTFHAFGETTYSSWKHGAPQWVSLEMHTARNADQGAGHAHVKQIAHQGLAYAIFNAE
jgi:hypothetical protein